MKPEAEQVASKTSRWRSALKVFAVVIPYMIPLFWMWEKTGYPDSLGIHIYEHGKAGLIEHWWYSYLLLKRAGFWDVMLFIYMWLPVVGFIVWLLKTIWSNRAKPADPLA